VKKLGLGGSATFQWSFLENPKFFYKIHFSLVFTKVELLDKYVLRKKIIAYVKDERSNFNVMTITLKVVVNYEYLGLKESF
jgi:hypothetical protein